VPPEPSSIRDVVDGISDGVIVEDYPNYRKNPCVLALQKTSDGRLVHVLWSMHNGTVKPAVLITAYIPDPAKWSENFTRRNTWL